MNIKKMLTVGGIVVACALPIVCAEMIKKNPDNEIKRKESVAQENKEEQNSDIPASIEKQLNIILSQKNVWGMTKDIEMCEFEYYTITDLNQNGRLELIRTTGDSGNMPTRWTSFYEISEDEKELVEFKFEDEDNKGGLAMNDRDFLHGIGQVVFDKSTEKYYYLVESGYHVAGYSNGTGKAMFSLEEGVVLGEHLGYHDISINDEKETFYRYINGKSKKISQKQYRLKYFLKERFKDYKVGQVHMAWFQFDKQVKKISDEKIREKLTKSYERFSFGESAKQYNLEKNAYYYDFDRKEEYEFVDQCRYDDVIWSGFQEKMTEEEYQGLLEYTPALTGLVDVHFVPEEKETAIVYGEKNFIDFFSLDEIYHKRPKITEVLLQDLTGDGDLELILGINDRDYVILHEENGDFYGIFFVDRWFQSPRKDGHFCAGKGGFSFICSLEFKNDTFVINIEAEVKVDYTKEEYFYSIGEKEVDKSTFEVWNKENVSEESATGITEIPKEKSETEEKVSFREVSGEYIYSSGAGGWRTYITIKADGFFEGTYEDYELGSVGKKYPEGTVYMSEFHGELSGLKKVNVYTYSVKVESLQNKKKPDEEELKNKMKYIYSEPVGLEMATELYIYLPGAPISELPKEFLTWIGMGEDLNKDIREEKLSFCGIYNQKDGAVFVDSDGMMKRSKIQ